MKEKYVTRGTFRFWMIVIFVVLLVLTYYVGKFDMRFENTPIRECHIEETITKRVIEPYCSSFNFATGEYCNTEEFVRLGAEYECEDGVKIFYYSGVIWNMEDEDKVCLEKTTEEVCEIV